MLIDGAPDRPLYPLVYDLLRAFGHHPSLHLVPSSSGSTGHRRAWLSAAGFGALGQSIEHAANLYLAAGATLARDPDLRSALRRLATTRQALN